MQSPVDTTLSNVRDAANYVACLHPALAQLRHIFHQVSEVQHNRHKCRAVFERAKKIVSKVNESLIGIQVTPHLESSVNQLLSYAAYTDHLMYLHDIILFPGI